MQARFFVYILILLAFIASCQSKSTDSKRNTPFAVFKEDENQTLLYLNELVNDKPNFDTYMLRAKFFFKTLKYDYALADAKNAFVFEKLDPDCIKIAILSAYKVQNEVDFSFFINEYEKQAFKNTQIYKMAWEFFILQKDSLKVQNYRAKYLNQRSLCDVKCLILEAKTKAICKDTILAIQILDSLLSQDSSFNLAFFEKSRYLFALGYAKQGYKNLFKVKFDPELFRLQKKEISDLLFQKELYDSVIQYLEPTKYSSDIDSLQKWGYHLFKKRRYVSASKYLNLYLKFRSEPEQMRWLALSYLYSGKKMEAQDIFSKIIEKDSSDIISINQLNQILNLSVNVDYGQIYDTTNKVSNFNKFSRSKATKKSKEKYLPNPEIEVLETLDSIKID